MIIDIRKGEILSNTNYKVCKFNNTKYYYKGCIFVFDVEEGEDSIRHIHKYYQKNKTYPFENMGGAFNLVICENEEITFFSDNSHLQGFYYSSQYVADNMLELVSLQNGLELDKNAICEFLLLGQNYFNKTLVAGVSLTETNLFYRIKAGNFYKDKKEISNIDHMPSPNSKLQNIFDSVSQSLCSKKLSAALTGGFDSRYVVTLLCKNASINTCISGDNPHSKDISISKKVATSLGLQNTVIKINRPILNNELLINMFKERGAGPSGFTEGEYRIYYFLKQRKAEGFDFHITGDTGVLYKDEHWIQDFPFYKKRNFSTRRFYYQRMRMIKENIPFSSSMCLYQNDVEKKIISWLENNKKKWNTESYDWYRYVLKHETGMKQTIMMESCLIDEYCPLMELRAMQVAFNLPRHLRMGAKMMKKSVTEENIICARIPTTTGPTMSTELKYQLYNGIYDIKNYLVKIIRLLGRRILKKTIMTENVLTWSYQQDFRQMEIVHKAVTFAKNSDIINKECPYEAISYSVLNKLLYLYLLHKAVNHEI